MITTDAARTLGLPENRLRPGDPADLVVFDAPTDVDALRLVARRTLVLRGGRTLARAEPARTTVTWDGVEEDVTFLR
jgi:cytosine deaminase